MHYGQDFSEAIDRQHALFDYDTDFWSLTQRMRIPVIEGTYNSAVYLPEPLITLHPDHFHGEWTFTRFHELAHTVLRDSGIEAQLRADAEYPEQFRCWMEAYCNFGAAQFQMPNPLLERVLRRHGYSPRAVLTLAQVAGVDLFDAMNRFTHGGLESGARRATLLFQGSYVRRAVTTVPWFPHQDGDRLPEPNISIPGIQLLRLPERFGRGRVLGVWGK